MSLLKVSRMISERLKGSNGPIVIELTPEMAQDLINLVSGKIKMKVMTKDGRSIEISWKDMK